ncbi:MAG: hypothetical protein IIX01_03615 [Clostridia bacterium]|nr:hypothetical protein [Clostridia bacterium]
MSAHTGHRKRIIAKLDSEILEPHELMEVCLFNALPRQNTNDIGHDLLQRFGSIQAVFEAKMEELKSVKKVGDNIAAYIRVIGLLFKQIQEAEKRATFPKKYESATFKEFINQEYAEEQKEVFDVYLLDEHGKITYRDRHTNESTNFVQVDPKALASLIVKHKPAGLVLVHNHLTADCMPSEKDESATCQIQIICSMYHVALCDHYIYSPAGIFSYYDNRRLSEISRRYAINNIVEKREKEKKETADGIY